MDFLLAFVGALVLLMSLAGVVLGSFMAADRRTREPGLYFALWWTPALAAGGGILMRDPVTFAIGTLCFVVAGATFALERYHSRRPAREYKRGSRRTERRPPSEETQPWSSEKVER